jgi:hypothetical protein
MPMDRLVECWAPGRWHGQHDDWTMWHWLLGAEDQQLLCVPLQFTLAGYGY